jgi:alkaline phosphatase
MSRQDFTRRSFFGLAAGAAAASMTPFALASPSASSGRVRGRQVKNIIWMVSDGMSMGVPSMLDHSLQLSHGRRSVWRRLMTDPKAVHGVMDTRSLNSMVTDSAAASTSWGSGVHVLNGALNTLPGTADLTTLYDLLGGEGMKRGLVTTATITHATPAGFAAAVRSRSAEPEIAQIYRKKGIEVLMGGGHEFFSGEERADKKDLYSEYQASGYTVCKSKSEIKKAPKDKNLLGIFSKGQIPYTIDKINSPELDEKVPSLAEMAEVALGILNRGAKGFILQVEGARIDHAAHANDLGAILNDQMAFEEALQVCLNFARKDGETLVVVTSDHGNANPGITGAASLGKDNGLLRVPGMKASFEVLGNDLKKAPSAEVIRDLIQDRLGIGITLAEGHLLFDAAANASVLKPFGNYRFATATLAMVVGTYTGVGWSSGSHTSDYTLLTALGPGAELFEGMVQNVDCFEKLLSVRGITFENPKMTLEEALAAQAKENDSKGSLQASIDPADEVHWV